MKRELLSIVRATSTSAALKESEMIAAAKNVLADKAVRVMMTHKAYRKSLI